MFASTPRYRFHYFDSLRSSLCYYIVSMVVSGDLSFHAGRSSTPSADSFLIRLTCGLPLEAHIPYLQSLFSLSFFRIFSFWCITLPALLFSLSQWHFWFRRWRRRFRWVYACRRVLKYAIRDNDICVQLALILAPGTIHWWLVHYLPQKEHLTYQRSNINFGTHRM